MDNGGQDGTNQDPDKVADLQRRLQTLEKRLMRRRPRDFHKGRDRSRSRHRRSRHGRHSSRRDSRARRHSRRSRDRLSPSTTASDSSRNSSSESSSSCQGDGTSGKESQDEDQGKKEGEQSGVNRCKITVGRYVRVSLSENGAISRGSEIRVA